MYGLFMYCSSYMVRLVSLQTTFLPYIDIVFFLQLNTFQCVIATDGDTTFAIFLYNKIEWTTAIESTPAKVGFNDGMPLSVPVSTIHCLLLLIHVAQLVRASPRELMVVGSSPT